MNMNMVNAPLNTKESFFGSLQPPIEVFFFPLLLLFVYVSTNKNVVLIVLQIKQR